jgi:hypothetical protein
MIIKDAVPIELQVKLKNIFFDVNFPWFFNEDTKARYDAEESGKSKIHQFTHVFFTENGVNSPFYEHIIPILDYFTNQTKLKIKSIFRIKANLLTKMELSKDELIACYHRDLGPLNIYDTSQDENFKNYISFIYYVYDSDGDTLILDKDLNIIESIEPKQGTIGWFKSIEIHTATPPKNHNKRIVINFVVEVENIDIV